MYCHNCGSTVPEKAKYCPTCGVQLIRLRASRDADMNQGTARPYGRRRGRMLLAFAMFLLVFVFEMIGYVAGDLCGLDVNVTTYVGGAAGAVVGMLAIGWRDFVVPRARALMESLRMGWWLLVSSSLFCVFEIGSLVAEGSWHIADGWPLRTLGVLVMCLSIGICEEGMFRGLLFGGLLFGSRGTDADVRRIAVISSAIFGLAHVEWWSLNYTDPMSLVQAVLKVVQTGMFGFFLSAVLVKTRNVTGSMLLHGFSNFLLLVSSVGLMDYSPDIEYVSSGPDSAIIAITYVVAIAMYVPLLIQAILVFRKPCPSPFATKG